MLISIADIVNTRHCWVSPVHEDSHWYAQGFGLLILHIDFENI